MEPISSLPETANEFPTRVQTDDVELDINTPQAHKRFKSVSRDQQQKLESANQSSSTKKNTAWGVRIFQGKTKLKQIKKKCES